jgi:hypothetical protein
LSTFTITFITYSCMFMRDFNCVAIVDIFKSELKCTFCCLDFGELATTGASGEPATSAEKHV